jgi:drug/metabolite transporter (DMT)-like permease
MAVSAAFCIALGSMIASELRDRVDVLRLVRWQFVSAFFMGLVATAIAGDWRTMTGSQFGLLSLSGFLSVIIAGIAYFNAIYLAGPRVTALLFSLTSPFALLFGYLVLGETVSLQQGLGIVVVLVGVTLAVGGLRRPVARNTARPWIGIAFGTLAALGQAAGTLAARPAMESGAEPIAAIAVRMGTAAIFFSALLLLPLPRLHRPYRFSARDLGLAAVAAFFSAALATALLMSALAEGKVGIVSTLSSMTPVVILPMVWIRSGVAPRPHAWLGALLAVAGTALISL